MAVWATAVPASSLGQSPLRALCGGSGLTSRFRRAAQARPAPLLAALLALPQPPAATVGALTMQPGMPSLER